MNKTRITRSIGALFALLLVAGLAIVSAPRTGFSKTATETYVDCKTAAAVQANNCYYYAVDWGDRALCNINWDINNWACYRALIKALGV